MKKTYRNSGNKYRDIVEEMKTVGENINIGERKIEIFEKKKGGKNMVEHSEKYINIVEKTL